MQERPHQEQLTVADRDTRIHNDDVLSAIVKDLELEKVRPVVTIETCIDSVFEDNDEIIKLEALPPQDKGRAAITILLATVILDSTTYGILLSYGVFQEYYTNHFVNHDPASWIGVLSNNLVYLGAPIVTYCCQHYTLPRKYYLWAGFVLCFFSLLVSAFMVSLPALIVTQGFCYGLGSLLIGIPELIILNTWFDKRRGLAYGIIFGASDLMGVAYTFLSTTLLTKFGLRYTLLVYAGFILCGAGPAILLIHERHDPVLTQQNAVSTGGRRRNSMSSIIAPASTTKTSPADVPFSPSIQHTKSWPTQKPKKRFFQRGVFYVFNICNLLQACGVYLPFIYLPVFATQLGHSRETAATILALGNVGMMVGDLAFGQMSDKIHVNVLISLSSGVSAVATFVMWGVFGSGAGSKAILISFAFIFGTFAGGFIVLWARMGTLFGERDAAMVFSSMSAGRGVGGILSGPVSQVLLRTGVPIALGSFGSGQYSSLIIFTGACLSASALMGGLATVALWWKKEENFRNSSIVKYAETEKC